MEPGTLKIIQFICHYGGHFVLPCVIANLLYPAIWKKASLFMVSTILVDLDHLMAKPIFDPTRCSIGYHFLHTEWAIGCYVLMLFYKKTRIVGIGLVLHMIVDYFDCQWMA